MVMLDLMQVPHKLPPPVPHRRGYEYGDMRCTNCQKWIDPDDPIESIEIFINKAGRRQHDRRFCPVNSPYVATLVRSPKFHGTRRKIVNTAPRY